MKNKAKKSVRKNPEFKSTVNNIRKHGDLVLGDAQELVQEAGESIKSAKKNLIETKRKVKENVKTHPGLAAAAASVAVVGVGFIARSLV